MICMFSNFHNVNSTPTRANFKLCKDVTEYEGGRRYILIQSALVS